jgi:phenylalanyl-tRNA synthetase beta chain
VPVIKIRFSELQRLLKHPLSRGEFLDRIPYLGCDVEGWEGEEIFLEFFPNRPDLYSVEGIARAFRSFLGLSPGLAEYPLGSSQTAIQVDPSVLPIRPQIVGCRVRGVTLDEGILEGFLEIQEDLHWALGRDRRKASIGIHDASKVVPPFRYLALPPHDLHFVPLEGEGAMDLQEVLERHPKGIAYAHLLAGQERYPVLLDSRGEVLSMPPIINGELTRVTEETRDLFIEVTGTEASLVNLALAIFSTACSERGWNVETIEVRTPEKVFRVPDLTPASAALRVEYANRMLGLALSREEIIHALERMGFGCRGAGETIRVQVPAYRGDILHEIDLVEEIAIAWGYEALVGGPPPLASPAEEDPLQGFTEEVQTLLLGYGYTEVMTLMLTHPQKDSAGSPVGPPVEIQNPLSEEHTILRTNLLQGILSVLELNRHQELPQRVFEVGDVAALDETAEIGARSRRRLCACAIHPKAGYSEVKALVEGLFRDLHLPLSLEEGNLDTFIPGRCASALVDGEIIGHFGEVHPRWITAFHLEYPIIALEVDLEALLEKRV